MTTMEEKQNYDKVTLSRRQIIVNNFLGGISWGLGTTIGLSVFFAILGVIISRVDLIPIIGDWVSQILNSVLSKNPTFIR